MASNATVDRADGNEVENLLETPRYDVEEFQSAAQYGVEATPMLFVNDEEPIGDRDDLMRWLARNAH